MLIIDGYLLNIAPFVGNSARHFCKRAWLVHDIYFYVGGKTMFYVFVPLNANPATGVFNERRHVSAISSVHH